MQKTLGDIFLWYNIPLSKKTLCIKRDPTLSLINSWSAFFFFFKIKKNLLITSHFIYYAILLMLFSYLCDFVCDFETK